MRSGRLCCFAMGYWDNPNIGSGWDFGAMTPRLYHREEGAYRSLMLYSRHWLPGVHTSLSDLKTLRWVLPQGRESCGQVNLLLFRYLPAVCNFVLPHAAWRQHFMFTSLKTLGWHCIWLLLREVWRKWKFEFIRQHDTMVCDNTPTLVCRIFDPAHSDMTLR